MRSRPPTDHMLHKMLRAKIHRPAITRCDPDYVGSITIDADLLRASGIRPNECVLVVDIDNGARFETYVILGEPGSGEIGVNGAAARLVEPNHRVIILAFSYLEGQQLDDHRAKVVISTDDNRVGEQFDLASTLPE